MEILKINVKDIVAQSTIKNLLAAQWRMAEEGSGADVVRVSKYLMRLSKKYGDVLVDAIPESNEQGVRGWSILQCSAGRSWRRE